MWARVFVWWWGVLFNYVGRSGCWEVRPLCPGSFASARRFYTNEAEPNQKTTATQTLAITGTSSSARADQRLSTGFSTLDEAFPLSSSSFCLLHPHPLCSLFLLFTSTRFSQFAIPGSLFFSPLRFVFCSRSSFSKSPTLHCSGSKDTCGDCVHSRAFVRFIKGEPAEWNCSFLNSWTDGATGRQKGDEGRGSWWREKISTFSAHLWISESVIDEGFEGRFQKAGMWGCEGVEAAT